MLPIWVDHGAIPLRIVISIRVVTLEHVPLLAVQAIDYSRQPVAPRKVAP